MKEKFIKSTIILTIGGLITKVLGMLIKIIISRKIGPEGLGLYMLILPTFSLFIGISQFGLPIALSKLIAEDTKNNKRLFASIIPIALIVNLILITTIIITAPFIATNLLHNKSTYYGLLSIAAVIPLISLSGICRSYFFGKQQMFPHVLSNILEDLVRLSLMYFGLPLFIKKGLPLTIAFIVLSNIISELASIIILIFYLPKNFSLKKADIIPKKTYIKESLKISLPNTSSRVLGSIGYFLEPIILTKMLLKNNYSTTYITTEYGIISGLVLPILLLPSFFTTGIAGALLPIVSKEYTNKNYPYVKRKIKQACLISLIIGLPITLLLIAFPEIPLKLIYNTTNGSNYLKFLAPICLLQYIQAPLSYSLDAMGKSKTALISTIISVVTRTIFLIILSNSHLGIWALIFSLSLNIILTSIYEIKKVSDFLK